MNILKMLSVSVLVFIFVENFQAQKIESWDKTTEDKKISNKFANNFYVTRSFIPFMGIHNVNYSYTSNSNNDGEAPSVIKIKDRNIDGITFEIGIKYTVFKLKDYLSISPVIYPFFSVSERVTLNYPIGIDISMFNSSSYNNINKMGFSIGFGREFGNTIGSDRFDYNWNHNFMRITLNYNKYKRKWKTGDTKMVKGFFGVYYSAGSNITSNDLNNYESKSQIRIVLGRTFMFNK